MRRSSSTRLVRACLMLAALCNGGVAGQFDAPNGSLDSSSTHRSANSKTNNKRHADPPGLKRLTDEHPLWIDPKRKHVVVDGHVCLREGQLEMFACPKDTKEHEAIIAVDCPARFVHAGLLVLGVEPGKPAQFDPQYLPASGPQIDIWILWIDHGGMHRKIRAQQWVRDIRTGKPMEYDWVFAGSGFWKDEMTGTEHYMADSGDFICVSNFTTATLDVTVQSSESADSLLFEAQTENIPNVGTHVRLVLIPKLGEENREKTGEQPRRDED